MQINEGKGKLALFSTKDNALSTHLPFHFCLILASLAFSRENNRNEEEEEGKQ